MKNLFLILLLSLSSLAYGQYIPDKNFKSDYQNENLTSGFKYIKTGRQIKYFSTGLVLTGGILIVDSRYSQNRVTRNSGIFLATMGAATWAIGEGFQLEGYDRLHLGFFQLRIDIGRIKEEQTLQKLEF
jgi:hypothetical protein